MVEVAKRFDRCAHSRDDERLPLPNRRSSGCRDNDGITARALQCLHIEPDGELARIGHRATVLATDASWLRRAPRRCQTRG